MAVGIPKISEEQLVEPPPKVSGLALVGRFAGVSKVNRRDVSTPRTAVSSKCTWSSGLLGHSDDHTSRWGLAASRTLGSTSSGSSASHGRAPGLRGYASDSQTTGGGAGSVRAREPISITSAA